MRTGAAHLPHIHGVGSGFPPVPRYHRFTTVFPPEQQVYGTIYVGIYGLAYGEETRSGVPPCALGDRVTQLLAEVRVGVFEACAEKHPDEIGVRGRSVDVHSGGAREILDEDAPAVVVDVVVQDVEERDDTGVANGDVRLSVAVLERVERGHEVVHERRVGLRRVVHAVAAARSFSQVANVVVSHR